MGCEENSSSMLDEWIADITQIIEERFPVESSVPVIKINPDLQSQHRILWNLVTKDNTLHIPSISQTDTHFIRAVLAREILSRTLQEYIQSKDIIFHLSTAFGSEFLDDTDEWYSFWIEHTPLTITSKKTRYCPGITFRILYNLAGEEVLDDLITSIIQSARYGVQYSEQDWKLFLFKFSINYHAPLSSAEVTIVDMLMRDSDVTNAEIAERAGISEVWVSTLISAMKKRHHLREFESVVYSKIGIRVFQVIVEPGTASQSDCLNAFSWCPYLYTSSSIVTGKRGIFATLAIPDNPANFEDLHQFIQVAKQIGMFVNVFERSRSARVFDFDSYDTDTGRWVLDWNAISLEADLLQRDQWASVFPLTTEEAPSRVELDKRDIRLLAAFQKGHRTVRDLRDAIRGRSADITSRLGRLRSEDVIRRIWEVHHVGLIEEGLVIANDSKVASICAALSLRTPKAYVDFDITDRLLMRTYLPSGGTYGLSQALARLDPSPEIHVLGERYHGAYGLENFIDDWDVETGEWMSTQLDATKWFNCLEDLM